MKIAYFHRLTFEDTEQRFKEEAERMGIDLVFIKYKNLSLESDNFNKTQKNKITFKGIDLKDFDIWFFRSVGSELEWSKLLQLYARDNNIPIVDDYILTEGVLKRFKSTMGYLLAKNGINYPQTTYFNTFKQVKNYLGVEDCSYPGGSIATDRIQNKDSIASLQNDGGELNHICNCGGSCGCGGCSTDSFDREVVYPFIIKMSSGGRHGMSTFFIQQKTDLLEMEKTLTDRKEKAIKEGKTVPLYRGFLLQEYIPNDGDFRVMTVGYKCIGGFKRAPKEEKLVLNKSQGKSTGMDKLPDDVIKTAEEAAKVLGIEVAGTDLVRHKDTGEVYIVEVNEAPQFKVFEKRTKINAPKMILDYLIEKANC